MQAVQLGVQANHGGVPLQRLLSEFIRGEEIVKCVIVCAPPSLHQIKQNLYLLVLLWASTGQVPDEGMGWIVEVWQPLVPLVAELSHGS